MATDLITLAEGAVLSQFLGPFGKSLGEAALKRAQQLGERAVGYLTSVGRAPQPVAPKVLLPLVQAAALEEDEGLAAKWAALLANAADPAQRVQVSPGFVEVLRQLTPTDARLVELLYRSAENASGTEGHHTVFSAGLMSMLKLSEQEMRLSLDTLLRLQLCRAVATYGGHSSESFVMPSALLMTTFGLRFIQSVASPGSTVKYPFS